MQQTWYSCNTSKLSSEQNEGAVPYIFNLQMLSRDFMFYVRKGEVAI